MGFIKKKVDNDLVAAVYELQEANYEKSTPEVQKLYQCLKDAHESVEDIFKKNFAIGFVPSYVSSYICAYCICS